jgi:hypothetical protein
MPQRRRIAIAVAFLAVIAVPVLAAIALGYHRFAFYGLLGAAIALVLGMPMALSVSVPAALVAGAAVLVTLLLGKDPLPLAAWMGLVALGVGAASIRGHHRAATLVAVGATVFIARTVPDGEVAAAALMFTAGAVYGVVAAGLLRHGPPAARRHFDVPTAVLYGVLLAALVSIATGVTVAVGIPHGYWAVLAIFIVGQPTSGTATRATKRATAVIVGVAASLVIAQLVHTQAGYTIIVALAVACAAYQATSSRRYLITAFLTVAMVLSSAGGSTGEADTTAVDRLVLNFLAIAATVAVAAAVGWVVGRREAGSASPAGVPAMGEDRDPAG